MNISRASIVIGGGLVLCLPLMSRGESVTAPQPPAPNEMAQTSPAASLDTAKRLEGRLFFSAQERRRLDEARKRGMVLDDKG
ncbi:MAG: hypothetical protein LH481_01355, partial [Burkholderiales bacterium]|nr:hypothetical protein [Burkholderiales bacterium]